MCLVGVVVRKCIDYLILLILTPLVSALFCSNIPTFGSFCYGFRSCIHAIALVLASLMSIRFCSLLRYNHSLTI